MRTLWPLLAVIAVSCSTTPSVGEPTTTSVYETSSTATTFVPTTATTAATTTTVPPTTTTTNPFARPEWLGTRLLPLRADGYGEVQPTPPELRDRQLETIDLLPPPESEQFVATIDPVPETVLPRSSWREGCPVALGDLVYITVSHYGFDEEFHTGEMIVHAGFAEEIVEIFRQLHEARFPIEQMRLVSAEELGAHPTGDGNLTTGFVCRNAVGSDSWSMHAYGLAVNINPFHNPYYKNDLVRPELASAYLDREDARPGMIIEDDPVVRAFAEIGWPWGGNWNTLKDWMHFSENGR